MAKMEKEHREIVEQVVRDIEDFTDAIDTVMTELKSKVKEMNDTWDDAQYRQFEAYVDELDANVKKDIEELGSAREKLEAKLKLYD